MSKSWCACFTRETVRPLRESSGISRSMSVVLPLPDHPANPKTRIALAAVIARGVSCPACRPGAVALRRAAADDRVDEFALGVRIPGRIAGSRLENRALFRLVCVAQLSIDAQDISKPIKRVCLRRIGGDDVRMKP